MQKRVWRLIKIHWKRLLALHGDSRKIARGIALGVAMNFVPTIGLGPPLVYWLAGRIKAHRVSAIVSTISVKFMIPLLYLINYVVGELLLGQKLSFNSDWHGVLDAGASFFLGVVTNFIITFTTTYYLVLDWIERRRNKHSGGF